MKKSEDVLRNGTFGRLVLSLSLPAIAAILIMIVYNIADTFFIGQTGDPNKISAISISMPVFTLLSAIGTLFGNGGTTCISIALGEQNTEKIQKVSAFCFVGCAVTGLVFFSGVFFFTRPLAFLLGADASTVDFTVTYLRTFAFACPLMLFTSAFGSLLRADGDGASAILPHTVGTVSNILLDALFILVFKWDVFGAALATVLGNVLSTVLLVVFLLRKKQFLLPRLKCFTLERTVSLPVLTLGLPMAMSTFFGSIASAVQNRIVMSYGSNVLAAQSVAGKASMVLTMLILGFCMGMQPAISYNYGAKQYRRMYRIIRQTGLCTIAVGLLLTVLIYVFRNAIVASFIDNADVISLAGIFVLASVAVGPFYGIYQLSQTFLQATGKVNYAIISSMLDKFLVFLPVLYLMNRIFGMYGVAFAHAVTMVLTLAITVTLALKWARELPTRA